MLLYNLVSLLTSVTDNCKANDRQMSFWLYTVGYPSLRAKKNLIAFQTHAS